MADAYKTPDKAAQYEYQYKKDYEEDWDNHRLYIADFDAYEAMLQSQVFDSVSRTVDGSKITDAYATTLAKERADRVMAKLPDGVTESAGKTDRGKAAFMDILRQKWYYPNANAQHPFQEKLNMWQFYSSVYGYMPMFYDWNVSPSGYAGPDCWLWNPRNLIPQTGRVSINDMDYVTALTWVSKKFLQDKLDNPADNDGWDRDALKLLVELADNAKPDSDPELDTQVSRTRTPNAARKGICLATRYEAGEDGKWCTFAPDHAMVQVREIANPHKNGRIPFVIKYSQPLFDSFYGLGDFQRAKPLQFARDALDNFYFKGIKMNLIPPIVANANGVLKHTLDYREGAVMLETIPQSIRRLETSPAGLATYQGAKAAMTGGLLAQFGSQNAAISGNDAQNPSQGRTPAAIDFYDNKEASRDGAEMAHLEMAVEQLIDGFNTLVVNIGTEDVPVTLFADDIKEINDAGLTDIMQLIVPDKTGTAGNLKINPKALQGVEYRFSIDPGSTTKQNKQRALLSLQNTLDNIGKFQNLIKDDPRVEINYPRIMKAIEQLSDIKGVGDFITLKDGPTPHEVAMQQQINDLQQQLQAEQNKRKSPIETIAYKDVPEDVKREMESQAGLQPSAGVSPAGTDQAVKHATAEQQPSPEAQMQLDAAKASQDMALKQQEHEQKMVMNQDNHQLDMVKSAQSHEMAMKQAKQPKAK